MTASTSNETQDSNPRASAQAGRAGLGWLTLLRPRIAVMVVLMGLLGAYLGQPAGTWGQYFEAAFYILLVTGSASTFNQIFERDTDALMKRTQHRPLVTGEISVASAVWFGAVLGIAGVVPMALRFNLLAALLLVATFVAYVAVYTPLKRVSTLNTVIGAIPGAAPPLLGYVALAGEVGPWAWCLFAILFAWQFPHFMAIAYLYREDYSRAGHRMLADGQGSPGAAGRQALLYALAIVPVSLMPVIGGVAQPKVYGLGAVALGVMYLSPAVTFALRENRGRARLLMFSSLLYLPGLFALILLDHFLLLHGPK